MIINSKFNKLSNAIELNYLYKFLNFIIFCLYVNF